MYCSICYDSRYMSYNRNKRVRPTHRVANNRGGACQLVLLGNMSGQVPYPVDVANFNVAHTMALSIRVEELETCQDAQWVCFTSDRNALG